jgi:hypothetical protein
MEGVDLHGCRRLGRLHGLSRSLRNLLTNFSACQTAIAFVAQVAWTRRRAIAEAATIDGRRRPSGTKAPDEWSEPDLGASGGSASNVS